MARVCAGDVDPCWAPSLCGREPHAETAAISHGPQQRLDRLPLRVCTFMNVLDRLGQKEVQAIPQQTDNAGLPERFGLTAGCSCLVRLSCLWITVRPKISTCSAETARRPN